jgi:hypothetical protein
MLLVSLIKSHRCSHDSAFLRLGPLSKWWPLALVLVPLVWASLKVIPAQWDFEVYYYAALAQMRGLDPYSTASLSAVAGKRMPLPFVYPPFLLVLFKPFAHLGLTTAKTVFLMAKLAGVVGLLALWTCLCRNAREAVLLLILAAFGFSNALFVDLYAGNVSCFEQLVLWLGIAALVTGHRMVFAILIPLAATAKGAPMAFVLLLLFERPTAIRPLLVSIATFIAVQGMSLILFFKPTLRFLEMVRRLDERGHTSPSSLAFLRDVLAPATARATTTAIYVTVVVILLAVFIIRATQLHRRNMWKKAPWFLLSGAILSYLLILPRLKNYGLLIAIPAATWLLARGRRGIAVLGLLLLIISAHATLPKALAPSSLFWKFLWDYYDLLCVFALWIVWWIESQEYLSPTYGANLLDERRR